MHKLITILLLMTANQIYAQKATTIKKTFSRETNVSIVIDAEASIVWKLLTDAENFPKWNSTVTSLEGKIAEGEKLRLKSVLDEKRTFKLKVKELIHESKMVWGDGKGNRVHSLQANPDGTTTFTMTERIGGLMFPMYAKYIPPFDEVFEQYVTDLKKEAEKNQNNNDELQRKNRI